MENYFFSRHEPHREMLVALGGLHGHIQGTISRVRRENDRVVFAEHGDDGYCERCIPVDSTVVLVGPLPLQEAFLRAGVQTLLIPQNRREIDEDGEVIFNYAGLLQVHEIKVVTSQWDGTCKSDEERTQERSNITNAGKQ